MTKTDMKPIAKWKKDFERKWKGGTDGLFVTEPLGTNEQMGRAWNFISQTILSAENNLLREIMEEMPKPMDYLERVADGQWTEERKANYNQRKDGFNSCHDQVNTILESKLSTVKK